MFSLAPSFSNSSLSCSSFSLCTISRTSALVQLSTTICGDCVGNKEEKEGDCVRIWQVLFRSFILATVSPFALFREPLHFFSCRRRFLVTASETKKKKKVIVISGLIDFGDCDFWTYRFRQEPPRIGTRKAPQRQNRQCRLRQHAHSNKHFIQLLLVLLHCVWDGNDTRFMQL